MKRPNRYGLSFCVMNTCDCTAEEHEEAIRWWERPSGFWRWLLGKLLG
jgi:hypothetical protein